MRAAIHITSSKFIKTLLVFVVCSIFSSAALVSNSFAYELTLDVWNVASAQPTISTTPATCLDISSYNIRNICADSPQAITGLTFNGNSLSILSGDFIQIWFYVGINTENNSADNWIRNININHNLLNTVNVEFDNLNNSIGLIRITARATGDFTLGSLNINPAGGGALGVLYYAEFISAGKTTQWRPLRNDYSTDIQSVVNAINNQTDYSQSLNSINNNINSVNNNLNTVNNNLNDLQETQEQANEDANDRYQDEKDTISGNGDDAQDSADSLDISFGVPWILQAWFNLFVDDSCASIPTISSWIHSTETRVCTPWPSAVRATLTPIFAIISGLLLFGFVIRWLRGGMFNNSIEVG